jgi:hypothetical protein
LKRTHVRAARCLQLARRLRPATAGSMGDRAGENGGLLRSRKYSRTAGKRCQIGPACAATAGPGGRRRRAASRPGAAAPCTARACASCQPFCQCASWLQVVRRQRRLGAQRERERRSE